MRPTAPAASDTRNLLLAIVLATAIMMGWNYFYERPHQAALHAQQAQEKLREAAQAANNVAPAPAPAHPPAPAPEAAPVPRITVATPSLAGTLPLVGLRVDDLRLSTYHETAAADSPPVQLFSPAGSEHPYFAEIGFLPAGDAISVPTATTRWNADGAHLTPDTPVTLTWSNTTGQRFTRQITVDDRAMLTLTQTVKNAGNAPVTLYPYGRINRNYADTSQHYLIMHEGPLGVLHGVLEDVTYKSLREDGPKQVSATQGWIGMTDKYWLSALIPQDLTFNATFAHSKHGDADSYQADYRGEAITLAPGQERSFTVRLFAGAKVVDTLDEYATRYQIPLFDRAVDFGSLYFLTKPIFRLLQFFHRIVGNFGVAILLLTVVIKLLLFPLAHKSMVSMARTKQLMPKIEALRARYGQDKLKLNQEMMALYKSEKVNPAAGCLPILFQIPIFLSLYRVLFVTIEMRQAPFYGWITDLSLPDPSNLFTLFGLVPWDAPHYLHLAAWPIIMCATMVVQQKLSPKPADEAQAMVMQFMPYLFLFLFSSFPAGLIIYWAWNNTLTILQMLYINAHLTKKGLR